VKPRLLAVLTALSLSSLAHSQSAPPLPFGLIVSESAGTSFTLVGAGARAQGMGCAFTAIADDATAGSFNPAGLAQLLVPEASVVGSSTHVSDDYRHFFSHDHPEPLPITDSSISFSRENLNFVSVTMPFALFTHRWAVQVSSQQIVDFHYSGTRNFEEHEPVGTSVLRQKSDQSGEIRLYSASLAFQATERLLLGVTVNRWDGHWEFTSNNQEAQAGESGPPDVLTYRQVNDLKGWNVDLGFLLRYRYLNVGARYRTPFHADYDFSASLDTNLPTPLGPLPPTATTLHWPATLNVGIALKPSDRWVIGADTGRTDWSSATFQVEVVGKVNFFDLEPPGQTLTGAVYDWHVGTEYLFLAGKTVLPLRLGFSREPQPARDRVTGERVVTSGYSLGIGVKRGWFAMDLTGLVRDATTQVSRMSEPDEIAKANLSATSTGELARRSVTVFLSFIVQFQRDYGPARILHDLFVGPPS